MEDSKTFKDDQVEVTNFDPSFDSSQLDRLEGDGVNIHCINSSEFVVGRQTNFNGPVTIINCLNDASRGPPSEIHELEKIIIKDKILSENATATMNKYAEKKPAEKQGLEQNEVPKGKKYSPGFCIRTYFFRIPICMWILFLTILLGLVIFFGFIYYPFTEDGEENVPICHAYNYNKNKFCIYSNFDGNGWRFLNEIHLRRPVQKIVISDVGHHFCFDLKYCSLLIESLDIDNSTGLPFCHFYVGGDGNFYESLSQNLRKNSSIDESVYICFVGKYGGNEYPTYPQVKAAKNFIRFGVKNNLFAKDYAILASHSLFDLYNESSIYNIIKKWPKFQSDFITLKGTAVRNSTANNQLKIYKKKEWQGLPAKSFVKMKIPIPYVVISHSVTRQCSDLHSCSIVIVNMQSYHFSKTLADIAYSFLVDSNGNVYEGRGWTIRNSNTGFINGRNIDINFIGDYSADIKPTENQFEGVKRLIKFGVEEGYISQNYSLISANSTRNTLSPGKNVYAVIKNWPHFDSDPRSHIKEFEDS